MVSEKQKNRIRELEAEVERLKLNKQQLVHELNEQVIERVRLAQALELAQSIIEDRGREQNFRMDRFAFQTLDALRDLQLKLTNHSTVNFDAFDPPLCGVRPLQADPELEALLDEEERIARQPRFSDQLTPWPSSKEDR